MVRYLYPALTNIYDKSVMIWKKSKAQETAGLNFVINIAMMLLSIALVV